MASRLCCVVLGMSMLIVALSVGGDLVRPAAIAIAAQPNQETSPSPLPATPPPSPPLTYSLGSIVLAITLFVLLLALFLAMVWWFNRVERTTYWGQRYLTSVEEGEFQQLTSPYIEKFAKDGYREDIEQDEEWLVKNPPPPRPGFTSSSPSEAEVKGFPEAQRKYAEWEAKVKREALKRHKADLDALKKKAKDLAKPAGQVDFAMLRGRGPEFVLEFTTIVVIIFTAAALGILGRLQNEQLGTLLAAVLGYVLGRSTTRSRTGAGGQEGTEEEKRTPVSTAELTKLVEAIGGLTRSTDRNQQGGQRPTGSTEGTGGQHPQPPAHTPTDPVVNTGTRPA